MENVLMIPQTANHRTTLQKFRNSLHNLTTRLKKYRKTGSSALNDGKYFYRALPDVLKAGDKIVIEGVQT